MVTRSGSRLSGQVQGKGHGVKLGEVWGPGRGSWSGKGSRFGGQGRGQGIGHGQQSRSWGQVGGGLVVTRSGVKVGGQGQGIGHGVKSGEVWGPGQGSRSGKGSRFGGQCQGQGMGHGQRSRSCGHNVWGQGRGAVFPFT